MSRIRAFGQQLILLLKGSDVGNPGDVLTRVGERDVDFLPPAGGNPFDQDLNTDDAVAFASVAVGPEVGGGPWLKAEDGFVGIADWTNGNKGQLTFNSGGTGEAYLESGRTGTGAGADLVLAARSAGVAGQDGGDLILGTGSASGGGTPGTVIINGVPAVSGTFANPTSITVTNGIITAIS